MELAGRYSNALPGAQVSNIDKQINQQLNILKTSAPNSQAAMQAMIALSELQNLKR